VIRRFDGQHFQIDDYLLRPGNAPARILSHRPRGAHRVKRVAKERLDLRRPFQHLSQRLQKVGTLTLNRVPDNYFESTEESAFAPSRLVPGIEPSEDRMLQGRLFSYADTQMYRLGAIYNSLPINRPLVPVNNDSQDGYMNGADRKGEINYEPSGINEVAQQPQYKSVQMQLSGTTQQAAIHKTLDFRQAGEYYRSLPENDKADLVTALSGDLGRVTNDANKYAMLTYFYKADPDYGTRLTQATHADVARVRDAASHLVEN
jgi:catalase